MDKYFNEFYVQVYVKTPSPFPPPHDADNYELRDDMLIKGMFKQIRSNDTIIANTQGTKTRGRFITGIDTDIGSGILRCPSTGLYYSIIGDTKKALPQACVQIKSYQAEIIDRPHDEIKGR